MSAGKRSSLISFERATAIQDQWGEEALAWAEQGQEWAAVYYGKGDERRQAAAEQGQQAATFQVLENGLTRNVMIRDRIILGGDSYDIVGIAPMMRGTIEFTGVRAL